MEPRRKSSIKWVALPKEYCQVVREIFESSYSEKIQGSELIVEGRIYREEIIVRVGYLPRGSIRQSNFEASVDFNLQKENALEMLNIMIDPIGTLFESFLDAKETEFPKLWQKQIYKEKAIYILYSAVNSRLEEEADRILGLDRGLVSTDFNENELNDLENKFDDNQSEQVH
ncbi:MAG: hypothetical protein SGJ18_07460 [Pseudomonadota bacterium]|nr:hypothetical protein [Pseudomonadota bacterium]